VANIITLTRVVLALFVVLILNINAEYNLIGTLLIIFVLLLDAIDGYIARSSHTASISGGVYDILADRIVENIFFIYFASLSLFSIWITFIFVIRGLIIDAIRSIFSYTNKTAFGQRTLHTTQWAKLLTCSRLSRASYNTLKLLTFVLYAQLLQPSAYIFQLASVETVKSTAYILLWSCVALSLVRAYPVIHEAFTTDLP
jgi:CDP-diacylglycerol--glycerol-3-phosphate 3-phosphatidyltransferase